MCNTSVLVGVQGFKSFLCYREQEETLSEKKKHSVYLSFYATKGINESKAGNKGLNYDVM